MGVSKKELKARRLTSICAVSAAAMAAGATQISNGAVVVTNVNLDIGFAAGNSALEIFAVSGGAGVGIATTTFFGFSRSLFIAGTTAANFKVKTTPIGGYGFANPLPAGIKFADAGGGSASGAFIQFVSSSGNAVGPGLFSDKYYAFTYQDGGLDRYGWIKGSLTSIDYDTLSYHVDSIAYEDTGIMIATGQTAIPEPSATAGLLIGAAMVAGSRGMRNWKKSKAA